MKKYRKSGVVISEKASLKKGLKNDAFGLGFLYSAWNNLPSDMTVEEKVIFIEISERILRAYHAMKRMYEDHENNKKN